MTTDGPRSEPSRLAAAALGDRATPTLLALQLLTGAEVPTAVAAVAASLLGVRANVPGAIERAMSTVPDRELKHALVLVERARDDPAAALDAALGAATPAVPSFVQHAIVANCASRLALDQMAEVAAREALAAVDSVDRASIDPTTREWATLARHLAGSAGIRLAQRSSDPTRVEWVRRVTRVDIDELDAVWIVAELDSAFIQIVKRNHAVTIYRLPSATAHGLRTLAAKALLRMSRADIPSTLRVWEWSDAATLRRDLRWLGKHLIAQPVRALFDIGGTEEPLAVVPLGLPERLPLADAIVEDRFARSVPLRRLRPIATPLRPGSAKQRTVAGTHRLYVRGHNVRGLAIATATPLDPALLPRKLRECGGGVLILHGHGLDGIGHMPSTAATPAELASHSIDIAGLYLSAVNLTGWGVVVIACGSGRMGVDGAMVPGALPAEFISRGASWVLASPWLVPDHDLTASFVDLFLTAVGESGSAAAGLVAAQDRWNREGGDAVFRLSWRIFH